MKRWLFLIIFCWFGLSAFAQNIEEARKKAEEIHQLVLKDVIYNQEELKSLYYQNIQIISLLGDIKSLLMDIRKELKNSRE